MRKGTKTKITPAARPETVAMTLRTFAIAGFNSFFIAIH